MSKGRAGNAEDGNGREHKIQEAAGRARPRGGLEPST